MTTINLKNYYPWYTQDEFIEVSDEVAAELAADKRYEKQHRERMRRNKSFYSLDAEDTEKITFVSFNDSPERIFDMKERFCGLCRALNTLPEIQGRRIEAHYLLGQSIKEIAEAEGVSINSICISIRRGLKAMKNYLNNF
jgi:RNA polymerase sigma-70 factor (ECF subfamily)